MPGPSWLSPSLPEAFLRRGAGERWLGVVIGEACGKNCIEWVSLSLTYGSNVGEIAGFPMMAR